MIATHLIIMHLNFGRYLQGFSLDQKVLEKMSGKTNRNLLRESLSRSILLNNAVLKSTQTVAIVSNTIRCVRCNFESLKCGGADL